MGLGIGDFFIKKDENAECRFCEAVINTESQQNSTSSLRKHLNDVHKIQSEKINQFTFENKSEPDKKHQRIDDMFRESRK